MQTPKKPAVFLAGLYAFAALLVVLTGYFLYSNYGPLPDHASEYISDNPEFTIVIDPGHGGYDPGTVANGHIYEKDIALALASYTADALHAKFPDASIRLTRSTDEIYWPENEDEDLAARVSMAGFLKADYYLSLHLNAADSQDANGYFGFFKSSDSFSRMFLENLSANLQKAGYSQPRANQTTDYDYMYVVDSQQIPSVLFEAGFMTSPSDLASLRRPAVLKKIAAAIADAYASTIEKTEKSAV